MFDRTDLHAAVSADIITAEQASRLEGFIVSRRNLDEGAEAGQESLRFLSNFNDIFITLGLIILFTGLTALFGTMAAPAVLSGKVIAGAMVFGPVAALAWVMMEYFSARRRMLLPSMALAVTFAGNCAMAAATIAASFAKLDFEATFMGMLETTGSIGLVAFGAATAAAVAVYARFRLPFALAMTALAVAGFFYVSLGFGGNLGYVIGGTLSLLLGIATMAAAIWFDTKDPERTHKASDNAFWLHLAAAPQIILGVSTIVTGSNIFTGSTRGTDNSTQAITLLLVLLALGLVSLALNRRALIAASILTFMFTLSFVLRRAGFDLSTIFMIVAIIIGGGVVVLGAGWKTARRAVLNLFPAGGFFDRLFPPEPVQDTP